MHRNTGRYAGTWKWDSKIGLVNRFGISYNPWKVHSLEIDLELNLVDICITNSRQRETSCGKKLLGTTASSFPQHSVGFPLKCFVVQSSLSWAVVWSTPSGKTVSEIASLHMSLTFWPIKWGSEWRKDLSWFKNVHTLASRLESSLVK